MNYSTQSIGFVLKVNNELSQRISTDTCTYSSLFLETTSLERAFSNTEIGESNFLALSLLPVTVASRLLSRMGVSIDQYRQRIGCFVRVATLLSNFKVRRYKINTFSQQSKDFGTALRVITRQVDYVFHSMTKGLRFKEG